MSAHTDQIKTSLHDISDDVKALLAATAHVAEDKVVQARGRLNAALASAKDSYATLQTKAAEGAKVADQTIRDHPYEAIGIAFGLGALIGFLLARRD